MVHKIIAASEPLEVIGSAPATIDSLAFDSRKVGNHTAFFALRGTHTDGHNYIENAIQRGANLIFCEELPESMHNELCYVRVADCSVALALAAKVFYSDPSAKIKLVGVTGTNGKTTIATLLHDLFERLGYRCGLLSTVVYKIGKREIPASHTTPDALQINVLLSEMVECGCEYCFMEVSSHSVVQNRIKGIEFEGGIFTNLTHDHLDYHGTFLAYRDAKKAFFDNLSPKAFALTNLDDKNGEVMLQNCRARRRSYSLRTIAHYHCLIRESHLDGTLISLNNSELWVQFIGRFNAYNLAAIYGAAMELGADREQVMITLSTLQPVAGRFECVRGRDGKLAIIDYAHTPDALQNVLETIGELKGGARVYTVVGCGGDRDATKRPLMARIAVNMSNMTILTTDNPRTESPDDILRQMREGLDCTEVRRSLVINDRREAIRTAITLASPGDIILIAGKGHETYQEIDGIRHHFDDKEEAERELGVR